MPENRLLQISNLIDWSPIRKNLEDMYKNKTERGGQPNFDVIIMFRILILQQWYGLSDIEAERQIADRLQSLDANRNIASVITFLKDQSGKSSKDIEIATGLHQPQVSLAVKILRERNWITEQETKINGNGRALRFYALRATIEEIINYYEAERSKEFARISKAIQRLRELSTA